MSEKEDLLNDIIIGYYCVKNKADEYKKQVEDYNKDIKKTMKELNKTEFETDNGLIAKVTTQKRESFDEDKLIQKIKDLGVEGIIKTKEYIDMDELENKIYRNELNASELTDCKVCKEVVTLKVTERKDK